MSVCVLLGCALSAAFVWSALILVAGLLRPSRRHPPGARALRFAVVICARDEERVIRSSVASALAADYPSASRAVFVLADNCTDATAAVAADAGATVWEKETPSRCKGDVLAWGLARLYAQDGFAFDAVAVFDADNSVAPGWFRAMSDALQDGETVVTGRRGASNARANTIAGWYAVYWSVINELSNRVRTNLGLSGKLTGTGFAFRASALGPRGWSTHTLVEDVEFTLQVNLAGARVAYVPEAEYADEQPVACAPMWRQLRRWATGGWQMVARYALAWLQAFVRHPSPRLFDAFFVLLTGQSLAFVFLFDVLAQCLRLGNARTAAFGLLCFALGMTVALAALARALSPRRRRPSLLALATFPVFSFVLVLSVLTALVWPTRRWSPIPHTGRARAAKKAVVGGLLLLAAVACASLAAPGAAWTVAMQTDDETGGLRALTISGDSSAMNWTQRCDGREFAWATSAYRWGTGTLKVDGRAAKWDRPLSAQNGAARYAPVAGLEVRVRRRTVEDGFEETYEWRNVSERPLALSEIDVHTPFRDDYMPRDEMWTRRCFAHVWAGGSSAWVCAMRMGGRAPHLGLAVTDGALGAYEIKLRSRKNGMSNYRGVIALSPPDVTLAPGAATSVAWRLFPFADKADFFRRVRALGGVSVTASDWTVTRREPVDVTFEWQGGRTTKRVAYAREGRVVVPFEYGNGKRTFAELNAIADPFAHVLRRARFLVAHQQANEPGSPYDGAFTQYDMETHRPRRWWVEGGPGDMEPGAERLGIGVSLAVLAQCGYRDEFLPPLRRYAEFVAKLCRPDGYVYSSLAPTSRRRDFNSPWAAEFFLEMYKLTGEKPYLVRAYEILLAVVRRKGSLILVESPDAELVKALKAAGLQAEADALTAALVRHKEFYLGGARGKERVEEVSFAPEYATSRILQFLAAYDFTGDARCLEDVRAFLPVFEANLGPQPSAWCHDIGLHHWDGYWFGKRQCWGDTLPNHWNGTGADTFAELARHGFGRDVNPQRARAIARQVLTLIRPDGGAGCAFVYPDRVNGQPAKFLDPLANDQDWVMLYYLRNRPQEKR